MKVAVALVAAALASEASAHYIWQQINKNAVYRYIRKNSNYNSPVTDLSSNDLRCNVGGATGGSTEVLSVAAGASITFDLDVAVYHQGPTSVYLSKAPGDVTSYDGSGSWFKIRDYAPIFSGSNINWQMSTTYTFNLPSCIAPGDYLLRMQQIGIHNPGSPPQFYVNCAQIRITGGGSTNPSGVRIPGAFANSDPGLTANIYNGLTSYTVPGPSVFSCSGSPPPSSPPPSNPPPSNPPPTGNPPPSQPPPPPPPPSNPPPSNCAALYGQCGGQGFNGPTCCATGTCRVSNNYYSQCL